MNDKELADQLDAEDRLKARGFEKKKCETCGGLQFSPKRKNRDCFTCQGKGYYWEGPLY